MAYSHRDNIAEMAKLGITDGFDYTNRDPSQVTEAFFQFCQQNLSEECGKYDIQPARIYIRADEAVNALATRYRDISIIAVNTGTLITMSHFFTGNRSIFQYDELKAFRPIHEHYSLDYISFQFAVQFTYYHELAHLIQKSPVVNNWLNEFYAKQIREGDGYDRTKHLQEFDADLHAATNAAFHIIDYWKRLPGNLKSQENLQLLIALASGAIFSYFLFLMEKYLTVYYKASTHPHPIVRISYTVDNLIKTVQRNLPEGTALDATAALRLGIQLAGHWFSENDKDHSLKEFAKFFRNESTNIQNYVNNVLIVEAKKIDYLVMNRYPGGDAKL